MKQIIILIVWLWFCLLGGGIAYASDIQFWNTEIIEGEAYGPVKIGFENEMRFNKDGFYYNHVDAGLNIKTFTWLSLGINFREVFERKDEEWKTEERPHFNAEVKYAFKDFIFKLRNRIELRFRDDKKMTVRDRIKATIELPVLIKKIALAPYVSDEIFYDFDANEMNRNRFYIGLKMKFTKNIQTETYYLLQSSKKEAWENAHMVGLKLKFMF